MNLGVIVGRFQVPELHEGHQALIDHVKKSHSHLAIVLGVSHVLGSMADPLDYPTRANLVKPHCHWVLPLSDRGSDHEWSAALDALIHSINPVGSTTLYGGRGGFQNRYHGKLRLSEFLEVIPATGTERRHKAANIVGDTEDFRAGVIYAQAHRYPALYPTVDVACVQKGQVLLVRKPGEEGWRFPGGFVGHEDETLEMACRRECEEETGLSAESLEYVSSHVVQDWRYTSRETGLVMTSFFACRLAFGKLQAGDDVAEAKWFDLKKQGHPTNMEACHITLMTDLLTYLKSHKEGVS